MLHILYNARRYAMYQIFVIVVIDSFPQRLLQYASKFLPQ